MRARSVKFFPPRGGRGPSFRITYDSIGEARRALIRVGASRNELRTMQSDLHLSYYQLTPPRFHKDKTKLYRLISAERKGGRVKNFYFLVARNKLCCLIKVPTMNIEPPLRDGRTRNTGRRFETRLVTLSGDSYDDLKKIQHEEDSLGRGGAHENNRIPDNEEAADSQMNESYDEEDSDTGSENNMIIDNEEVDSEEILYSDPEEFLFSDLDMSGSFEI